MPDLWCPTAARAAIPGLKGAGSMLGGPSRAVHHTTEGSTARGAEQTYARTGNGPHLTVDYALDVVRQHLPADVAATALRNSDGGVQTNRLGRVCIQIEWVGFAKDPFTAKRSGAGPNVRGLLDWLRAWGVPNAWPMGAPKPYPASYGLDNGDRDPQTWSTKAGHYGHSQVPENEHGDPGAIDPGFVRQSNVTSSGGRIPGASAPKDMPAPYRYTHLPLRRGDRNGDVKHVQQRLRLPADGIYGPRTEAAVRVFQRVHHLAVDGVVGPRTAKALG